MFKSLLILLIFVVGCHLTVNAASPNKYENKNRDVIVPIQVIKIKGDIIPELRQAENLNTTDEEIPDLVDPNTAVKEQVGINLDQITGYVPKPEKPIERPPQLISLDINGLQNFQRNRLIRRFNDQVNRRQLAFNDYDDNDFDEDDTFRFGLDDEDDILYGPSKLQDSYNIGLEDNDDDENGDDLDNDEDNFVTTGTVTQNGVVQRFSNQDDDNDDDDENLNAIVDQELGPDDESLRSENPSVRQYRRGNKNGNRRRQSQQKLKRRNQAIRRRRIQKRVRAQNLKRKRQQEKIRNNRIRKRNQQIRRRQMQIRKRRNQNRNRRRKTGQNRRRNNNRRRVRRPYYQRSLDNLDDMLSGQLEGNQDLLNDDAALKDVMASLDNEDKIIDNVDDNEEEIINDELLKEALDKAEIDDELLDGNKEDEDDIMDADVDDEDDVHLRRKREADKPEMRQFPFDTKPAKLSKNICHNGKVLMYTAGPCKEGFSQVRVFEVGNNNNAQQEGPVPVIPHLPNVEKEVQAEKLRKQNLRQEQVRQENENYAFENNDKDLDPADEPEEEVLNAKGHIEGTARQGTRYVVKRKRQQQIKGGKKNQRRRSQNKQNNLNRLRRNRKRNQNLKQKQLKLKNRRVLNNKNQNSQVNRNNNRIRVNRNRKNQIRNGQNMNQNGSRKQFIRNNRKNLNKIKNNNNLIVEVDMDSNGPIRVNRKSFLKTERKRQQQKLKRLQLQKLKRLQQQNQQSNQQQQNNQKRQRPQQNNQQKRRQQQNNQQNMNENDN